MGSLDDIPIDAEDVEPTATVKQTSEPASVDLDILQTGNALTVHHNGETHHVPLDCPEHRRIEDAEGRLAQIEAEADSLHGGLNETRADLWREIAKLHEENKALQRDVDRLRQEVQHSTSNKKSLWRRFTGWLQ